MGKIADKYFVTHPYKVIEKNFDPAYARVSESVFSLSNETLGVRGYFDEGGAVDSLRGTYINGVYEVDKLHRSYKGIVDKTHYMIPAADWLYTEIEVDGEKLDLEQVKFSEFTRELNMRNGTLTRQFIWHTKSGKNLRLTFLRFVDMEHGERAYQRVTFLPLNFSGKVYVTTGISFNTKHEMRNRCYWGECNINTGDIMSIESETITTNQKVLVTACVDFAGDKPEYEVLEHTPPSKTVSRKIALRLTQKKSLNIDKRAVIIFDPLETEDIHNKAQKALTSMLQTSFNEAMAKQNAYYERHWQLTDVVIEPSSLEDADSVAEEQQGIRFCVFQMAQTYKGGSVRHNIGAKGLTGEAYNGHAFWDTEACCLPFYLFTNPSAAKSLLQFRYNTLPQAIERAKMLDCEGACYPIATLNGEEACNLWQHASLQFQPSTAVAYGIWHYTNVTGDTEFLWEYGAEILLQIARFLVSRCAQNPHTDQYGYYGVMGPDEFHMMVNNNAYTNYMGKRSLEYAADTLLELEAEKPDLFIALVKKTELSTQEIARWREIANNMALPITAEGLIEQHDGYFDLPHIDINAIPISEFPLYNHWSYDRIYRTNMIKQPDVLMFLYLYNSSFSTEVKRLNYEYYEPRTIHESSLSPAIHSILAAELSLPDDATKFFGYATRLDLDNYNRNTNEGLHTTSIAMAWINIIYGFAGLRSDSELLKFAPWLPKRWKSIKFPLVWRGRVLEINMNQHETTFTLRSGEALEFFVYGSKVKLCQKPLTIAVRG